MPPMIPLNLYCTPKDVYDYVGVEGIQLRLDDHHDATGQRIRATSTALLGATALPVAALQAPLLRGTELVFDGGGAPAVVQVVTTNTAPVGATSLPVAALEAEVPALAQAFDSGVNVALAQRLVKGCHYGTSQVKMYLCGRYDDSALYGCWSASRFATIASAKWVCTRRGQSCPRGILDDWEEALEEMRQIRVGMLDLEDVGTRTAGWPFISNVTVDIRYTVAKARVETNISEMTPTQYAQYVDWNSVFFLEV